jgi:prepilin-type N-terminal cleavage/methylation domain-containing protein
MSASQCHISHHRAFSLVELLVVVAIMGILGSLLAINGPSLLSAGALTGGSQIVVDNFAFARDHAMSKSVPTFVAIQNSGDKSWQRIAVFALRADSVSWEQVSQWKNLPDRAFVDSSYDPQTEPWSKKPTDLTDAHSNVPAPSSTLRDGSRSLAFGTDYLCVGFLPSGALLADNNLAIRIVRGRRQGADFTADGGASTPTDWVKLLLEKSTGRSKEIRPNQS